MGAVPITCLGPRSVSRSCDPAHHASGAAGEQRRRCVEPYDREQIAAAFDAIDLDDSGTIDFEARPPPPPPTTHHHQASPVERRQTLSDQRGHPT